ncbi:reverse transcriptase [Tanacetum coccineum]
MAMKGLLNYNFHGLIEMMSRDEEWIGGAMGEYEEVLKMFGAVEDPMAHLKNLRQDGTIKPKTLVDTYCLANLQEATNEARIKSKQVFTSYRNTARTSSGNNNGEVMVALDGEEEELTQEECLVEEGDIKYNFLKLRIEFMFYGKKVVLRGTRQPELQWMQGRQFSKQVVGQEREIYPLAQKDTIKVMVKELLEIGAIRQSNSPFSSPIVIVKKRMGHEECALNISNSINKLAVKDKFPIDELIELDVKSYHQIRVCEEDIYRTAFKTHDGHYEFLIMPFDLSNAPSTFQALVNNIFRPFLMKFTLVEYLRHIISRGLVGYYRNFVKGYAAIAQPLTSVLKKNAFKWSEEATLAFKELQQAMVQSRVLTLPNFEEDFIIKTDASGFVKKGKENVVADALSRATLFTNPVLKSANESLQQGTAHNSKYTWTTNELRRKGKLVVGNDEAVRLRLIAHFHSSAEVVILRNKLDLAAYLGLLHPLPFQIDISMDFIEALLVSQGKIVIMVVVDRLSKYAHFIPLSHPYTAAQVAKAFLDNIYKLQGLHSTILSDRDKDFISLF